MTAPVGQSDAAVSRYTTVTALDRWAVRRALQVWALLDLSNPQGSFEAIVLPTLLDTVSVAQETAAGLGAGLVAAESAAQGADPGPRVVTSSFAGVASDGRSLVELLAQPLISTYAANRAGVDRAVAMQAGSDSLDRIVTTQIHDAARVAEATAIASNRDISGYLRVVESGACSRCIILAGRFYKFNEGFHRHPSCRCSHHPLTRKSEPQSPRELFDSMSTEEQNRVFTPADAEAIRLGADPAKVVNARRGMSTTATPSGRNVKARVDVFGQPLYVTSAGTKQRAYTGPATGGRFVTVNGKRYFRNQKFRLMPESILELAKGDRAESIRLLRFYGYIF